MINIQNLSKSFGKQLVLNNINIEYKDNGIYGLVGFNGAGKTTFFKCIMGLLQHEGSIAYNKELNIGYLPTDMFMYPKITGLEYIEFCMSARKISFDKTALTDWNKLMQLPLDKYAQDYSTGMKKKLALLAIILQSNDILILDEPFNGLDLTTNLFLVDILQEMKKAGKIILISSHILQTLKDICDSIEVLDNRNISHYNKKQYSELDDYFKDKRKGLINISLLHI
ncbi:MAG: ATP-binding cassette domain-containing protein [Marinifilaceae bacterium]